MNRTVSISINSINFHIDENAYNMLKEYLDSLDQHFSKTEGKEEIMQDIESRISEILLTKINEKRNVVLTTDIEEIISILGKPEEIDGEGENDKQPKTDATNQEPRSRKKLYRDPDNRVLGGVASGIAWYFNIDPTWVRLAFIVTFFFSGPLIYIIGWIIIPMARTTSEKLDMKGEYVTINNIENSIKEEFNEVKKRVKDYSKEAKDFIKNNNFHRNNSNLNKTRDFLEDIIFLIIRSISIFIGIVLVGIGLALLIALFASIFLSHSAPIFFVSGENQLTLHYISTFFPSNTDLWLFSISILLLIGVPLIMMIYGGVRLAIGVHKKSRIIKWTSLSLWLCGVVLFIYSMITFFSNFRERDLYSTSYGLTNYKTHNYYLKTNSNNKNIEKYFLIEDQKRWKSHVRIMDWQVDTHSDQKTLFSQPKISFASSENDSAYITVNRFSYGRSNSDAKSNAQQLKYNVQIKDSCIILDKYITLNDASQWRNQNIEIVLTLPLGSKIYFENDLPFFQKNTDIDLDHQNIKQFSNDWVVTNTGLKCIDCK